MAELWVEHEGEAEDKAEGGQGGNQQSPHLCPKKQLIRYGHATLLALCKSGEGVKNNHFLLVKFDPCYIYSQGEGVGGGHSRKKVGSRDPGSKSIFGPN